MISPIFTREAFNGLLLFTILYRFEKYLAVVMPGIYSFAFQFARRVLCSEKQSSEYSFYCD